LARCCFLGSMKRTEHSLGWISGAIGPLPRLWVSSRAWSCAAPRNEMYSDQLDGYRSLAIFFSALKPASYCKRIDYRASRRWASGWKR
jgi:hypothetical protein